MVLGGNRPVLGPASLRTLAAVGEAMTDGYVEGGMVYAGLTAATDRVAKGSVLFEATKKAAEEEVQ